MKYLKSYNEQMNPKKILIGGALAASLATGCSKDDDSFNLSLPKLPNQVDTTQVDSEKVDQKIDKVDKIENTEKQIKQSTKNKPPKKKKSKVLNFKSFFKKKK